MKFFELRRIQFLLMGVIITSSLSGVLWAGSLPISMGPLLRISPIPGPANPDPVLQNLPVVMDAEYQPPYYPGVFDAPDYLSDLILWSDNYIANGLVFNPCNDNIMNITFSQNLITDLSGTFNPDTILTNTLATSYNKGLVFNYGSPVEQILPLGGTISQIINASFGPGLATRYTKNGRLDASGWGFFDTITNPPNSVPTEGFLFTSSYDNGQSFNPIQKVLSSTVNSQFTGAPYNVGIGVREFYVVADKSNPDILYASTMFTVNPNTKFGNLYYMHSENAGKNFSDPELIYSMVNDPVWQNEHFDPAYISDPNYFIYGGFSLSSGIPVQLNSTSLLMPIFRSYPKVGSPTYLLRNADTNFDQAVVRSLDNGKTWLKTAAATPQFTGSFLYDPGFVAPNVPRILEGEIVGGRFYDGGSQSSHMTVSPTTGRIYIAYQAGNPVNFPNAVFPIRYVLLNSSSDEGASWSPSVQINKTPTDIPLGAQQCFSSQMVATLTGQIAIAYYDFRNWTGTVGEDLLTNPLPLDAWLAIYDETEDPNGGSTGVGLNFVGEIRLSPFSSNARIPSITPPPFYQYLNAYITGTPEGITMTVNNNNELFVAFSMTQPGQRSKVYLDQYKGMTIDTNSYFSIMLGRYKFPLPNNN